MKAHRPYELEEYNPQWKKRFADAAKRLGPIFGDNLVELDHVGSTSIEGMVAKPQIDVLAVVNNLDRVKQCYHTLTQAGFTPRGRGYVTDDDEYLTEDASDGHRLTSVHTLEVGNLKIARYKLFRDYLQTNTEDRNLYIKTKRTLYLAHKDNYREYDGGKHDVITGVLARAKQWGSVTFSVRIKPNSATAKQLLRVGEQLKQSSSDIVLEDHPHITLYVGQAPTNNTETILSSIQEIMESTKAFRLKALSYYEYNLDEPYYVGIRYEASDALKNLHASIVQAINPLRSGMLRDKDEERLKRNIYTPQERERVLMFGYRNVMDAFEAHITLGTLASAHKSVLDTLPPIEGLDILVNDIEVTFKHNNGEKSATLLHVV